MLQITLAYNFFGTWRVLLTKRMTVSMDILSPSDTRVAVPYPYLKFICTRLSVILPQRNVRKAVNNTGIALTSIGDLHYQTCNFFLEISDIPGAKGNLSTWKLDRPV